jgi:hypothetical protein
VATPRMHRSRTLLSCEQVGRESVSQHRFQFRRNTVAVRVTKGGEDDFASECRGGNASSRSSLGQLVVLLLRKAHGQYRRIVGTGTALSSNAWYWCRVTVGFGVSRLGGEGLFDAHCCSLRT